MSARALENVKFARLLADLSEKVPQGETTMAAWPPAGARTVAGRAAHASTPRIVPLGNYILDDPIRGAVHRPGRVRYEHHSGRSWLFHRGKAMAGGASRERALTPCVKVDSRITLYIIPYRWIAGLTNRREKSLR